MNLCLAEFLAVFIQSKNLTNLITISYFYILLLGFESYRRKKRGNRQHQHCPFPRWGGYGGKIWPWNQICTPRKEEKKYYTECIKLKLKQY